MPPWLIPLLQQLIPILWGLLGPLITGTVEHVADATGKQLPGVAKVGINYGAGIGLATMMSGDPNTQQMTALAGALGAMIGNRIREAMKKDATKPPKP